MHLKIKTLKGETFKIEIDESATFYDLKMRIKEVKSVGVNLQKIVYKGKAMENEHILAEIGVRDEDTLVLMQTVPRKPKPDSTGPTVEKDKEQSKEHKKEEAPELEDPELLAKIQQLQAMGFSYDASAKSLAETHGNVEEALMALTSAGEFQNSEMGTMIRQEILKALNDNQEVLANAIGEDGASLSLDLQSMANLLGQKNEQLKKMLQENPEALEQLLLNNVEEIDEEFSEGSSPVNHEMEMTEDEEQSILKLMGLGFERDDVIQVFFACEKNEEMAANMLFDRQANGDFDDQV